MLNKCPHCKKTAVSGFKKFITNTTGTFECRSCGAKLGLPRWTRVYNAVVVVIAFYPLMQLNNQLRDNGLSGFIGFAAILAIVLAVGYLFNLFIPLESRE